MKTVIALVNDKAGSSSTKLALMIGLSSSAVLILVLACARRPVNAPAEGREPPLIGRLG